ncbi:MAG: TOBE domain-containing protein, partial [Candidatus Baldrarchaeia archaeon]
KVWLEYEGNTILGKGGAELLQTIKDKGSLTLAAKELSISYRYAWGYLKKIEKRVGIPVVSSFKGGPKGGGGMKLTETGEYLLRKYKRFEEFLEFALQNPELWEAYGLRIKERNRIIGEVIKIEENDNIAVVKIKIKNHVTITSIITREASEELNLRRGDRVKAVIKATEVMVNKKDG